MTPDLFKLIKDYQESVQSALEVMQRSGIPLPRSWHDWLHLEIPQEGFLNNGARYYKHGIGCCITSSTISIDFDFGENGEINGFDAWRLFSFAGSELADYGFRNLNDIQTKINDELANGAILQDDSMNYYISADVKRYASEVLKLSPDDLLPSPNEDPVLTLYAHYFLAADLMRENYRGLTTKANNEKSLNRSESCKAGIYFRSWLGFLAVTCEGFNSLSMRILLQTSRPTSFAKVIPTSDKLGKIIKQHEKPLRAFRNDVFHLRENTSSIDEFLDPQANRLPWADELHKTLELFFSKYRVSCEVHYVLTNRNSESQLVRDRLEKKSKKAP